MKQYMAVVNDKYQLPICCCDTAKELGYKLGLTKQQVFTKICHDKQYKTHRNYYSLLCIDIGDPYITERGDFIGKNLGQVRTSKRSSKACARRQG